MKVKHFVFNKETNDYGYFLPYMNLTNYIKVYLEGISKPTSCIDRVYT